MPPPVFWTVKLWLAAFWPCTQLGLRLAGLTERTAGAAVTVKVTPMVFGLPVAPGAVTVMVSV